MELSRLFLLVSLHWSDKHTFLSDRKKRLEVPPECLPHKARSNCPPCLFMATLYQCKVGPHLWPEARLNFKWSLPRLCVPCPLRSFPLTTPPPLSGSLQCIGSPGHTNLQGQRLQETGSIFLFFSPIWRQSDPTHRHVTALHKTVKGRLIRS